MGIFLVMYTISGIIVFRDIKKENSKRDIITFIALMIIALVFGVFYFKDPYQESLIEHITDIINIE